MRGAASVGEYEGLFAEVYDAIQAFDDDVPFFVEAAADHGSPVLELGSGTGRLLLPMAAAGAEVTGLDPSRDMLKVCRAKLAALGPEVRSRVRLVQGDMRGFRLERRFSLAVLGCDTILHLLTPEDQVRGLLNIRRHLRTGGTLLVDNSVPAVEDWVRSSGRRAVFEFAHPVNGNRVVDAVKASYDFASGVRREEIVLSEFDGKRLLRSAKTTCASAIIFPRELLHLLGRAGFDVVHVWKNHMKEAFDAGARQVIVEARRSESRVSCRERA
ncbi:MAG: class I SAM-dependent methyltransferase [Elusimicrobia bacterium]|nr:class I SAM-dependent methyltransferase [Elusimicrobiota bacterium]